MPLGIEFSFVSTLVMANCTVEECAASFDNSVERNIMITIIVVSFLLQIGCWSYVLNEECMAAYQKCKKRWNV